MNTNKNRCCCYAFQMVLKKCQSRSEIFSFVLKIFQLLQGEKTLASHLNSRFGERDVPNFN